MPNNNNTPGSARGWLDRAKGDLALARIALPEEAFYEDLCFHAQQAAEKAIKAIYIHHSWTFRYVHDLEELLTGLQQKGLTIPKDLQEAVVLTSYTSQARYPGMSEPVTSDEHQQAVALADTVLQWAINQAEGKIT